MRHAETRAAERRDSRRPDVPPSSVTIRRATQSPRPVSAPIGAGQPAFGEKRDHLVRQPRSGVVDHDLKAPAFGPADSATRPPSGAARQALRRRFRTTCRTGKAVTDISRREPVFPAKIDLLAAHFRADEQAADRRCRRTGGRASHDPADRPPGPSGRRRGCREARGREGRSRRRGPAACAPWTFSVSRALKSPPSGLLISWATPEARRPRLDKPLLVGEARHQRLAARRRHGPSG